MPKKEKRKWNSPEKAIRQFLDEEECKRADAYEQKLNADESLKDIEATPEMFEDIMRRVAAVDAEKDEAVAQKAAVGEYVYVSQEDREAMELGKKVLARRKYRKVWRGFGVAAALLAVVVGVSVSTEAGRFRIANFWNFLVGQETVIRVENHDPRDAVEVDFAEKEAWSEIEKKTGIVPVKFMYLPDGMKFDSYEINEVHRTARLVYMYRDTFVKILMTAGKNITQSLKSELHYDGTTVKEIPVATRYGEYVIVETKTDIGNNYMVSFERDSCSYSIIGVSTREEFKNMIENIFF